MDQQKCYILVYNSDYYSATYFKTRENAQKAFNEKKESLRQGMYKVVNATDKKITFELGPCLNTGTWRLKEVSFSD